MNVEEKASNYFGLIVLVSDGYLNLP